jgi:hypothetical protein
MAKKLSSAPRYQLVWVRVDGKKFQSIEDPGQQLKLWTESVVSPNSVEIIPKKSQDGRVYLVVGDRRGTDVWEAEILGSLAKP